MPTFLAPPRPRFVLRVGATGHRLGLRLPAAEVERVDREIASILNRLAAAGHKSRDAHAGVYDPAKPELRLISALAEGADRIAAHKALEAGWSLDVVLPFQAADYEEDFKTKESRAEFRGLAEKAGTVFCLDMSPELAERPRGYEAASHITLDNCDILLAVWDGKPGRGRGGTPSLIAEAMERGVPVLHVHATEHVAPRLLRQDRDPSELKADLSGLVEQLLAPSGKLEMLDQFYREAELHGAAKDGRILGWWRFARMFSSFARLFGARHGHHDPELEKVDREDDEKPQVPGFLEARYEVADAVSTHLGHVYRSAFMLVFLASGFAVVAGLAAVFWWDDYVVKAIFVIVELCLIGVLLLLIGTGRRRAWHRRWLDTRRLAELLRVAAALAPAGGSPPIAPPTDEDSAWTEWYTRSALRETHLPNAVADKAYLRRISADFVLDLIDGQIDYHRSNARRLLRTHHGLDTIGLILFGATAAIGVLFVAAAAFIYFTCFHSEPYYGWFKHWVKPAVTLGSAGLPALGAALYGIRAQGDYEASASRSVSTAKALLSVRSRILAARQEPDFVALRGLFTEAAEIMQSDLSDWRNIYRHRPIPMPA